MISIIIPFYGRWDLVHARLMEFYRFLPKDGIEIVLIDDCSKDSFLNALLFWQNDMKMKNIRYFRNDDNLGFGGSMNRGAEVSTGDILIFYSNDVLCSGNFIPQIQEKIREDVIIGNEIIYWPAGWNEIEIRGKKFVIPYANGWFICMTRSTWNKLDGFDPRYGKYDYEDVDLSTQAYFAGIELIGLNSSYLRHIGGQTVSFMDRNRIERTKQNREKFIKKWSNKFMETIHD